jgi:hypothetical protein
MTTTKKRVNISVSVAMEEALKALAKRDQMPVASKAAELLRHAIEIEEDEVWVRLASARDTKDAKFISHKDAWV